VLVPPLTSGERVGDLTKQACQDVDPCNVAYFYGIKGTPIDTAVRQGFDQSISSAANIVVVAEGEGKYLGPEESMKGMQDILQKTTDIDVVVGADQSIQGSQLALQDAGMDGDVKLVGFGGSEAAIKGVQDGSWFGDVFGAPATEGKLTMEGLVKAITDGTESGGIDPASTLPDNSLVTSANVSQFTPEWAG
jgi:ribose transport system substrate-binding protein